MLFAESLTSGDIFLRVMIVAIPVVPATIAAVSAALSARAAAYRVLQNQQSIDRVSRHVDLIQSHTSTMLAGTINVDEVKKKEIMDAAERARSFSDRLGTLQNDLIAFLARAETDGKRSAFLAGLEEGLKRAKEIADASNGSGLHPDEPKGQEPCAP